MAWVSKGLWMTWEAQSAERTPHPEPIGPVQELIGCTADILNGDLQPEQFAKN